MLSCETATNNHSPKPQVLVLGTADWDQPIATNQHYLASELAIDYEVIFVESMGLRKPTWTRTDIARIWSRITNGRANVTGKRFQPKGLTVVKPLVIPIHVGLIAKLNRRSLHRQMTKLASSSVPIVLWTYTPVTYGLEKFAKATVYHCVDLLGEVKGVSRNLVATKEVELAAFADMAVGSSPVVAAHLRLQNFHTVELWENVADVGLIESAEPQFPARVPGRLIFAGNLTSSKVDFSLLATLVSAGFDLQLAGPIGDPGSETKELVNALVRSGATYHGHLSLIKLASLYWTCEIGLVPYLLNSYTQGVSPLKTYEYLAAGLGIVSTAIPSMTAIPGALIVATPAAFPTAVSALRAQCELKQIEARRAYARVHSWVERGDKARKMVAYLASNSVQTPRDKAYRSKETSEGQTLE